jgi:hypothetical protein
MDIPVLTSRQTRDVTLDDVTYSVRALSYAEVGEIMLATAARPRPSETVIWDAIRQACTAAGRQDLAEAIDEYDATQDALAALYTDIPSDADPEGRARWHDENAGELRSLNLKISALSRRREAAQYLGSQDAQVARMRAELAEFGQFDTIATVAAGLARPESDVRNMPAHHVAQLAGMIRGMSTPGVSAAKN